MLTNARTDFPSSAPGKGNFPSNHPVHEPGKGADERNYSNVPRELGWWLLPPAAHWGERLQKGDYMENGLMKDVG